MSEHNLTIPAGVSAEAWHAIGAIVKNKEWHIPERNAEGEVIGWSRRLADGTKTFKWQGKRGLTLRWPLETYAGSSPHSPVFIVEDHLMQVVLNLLSNSVKYTPEGGRVTVGGDTDNLTRCVVVTVSDTGLGIPPDSIPKLFDKFYRVENYKRLAKGTGLGLSLCKHIVENVHYGQIGVESKLGMGSKFWFSIPMRYVGSRKAA